MHAELLEGLRAALGAEAIDVGDHIDARYLTDWSGIEPVRPVALLRPTCTAQVAAALKLCHRHRVPVVAQGGLTGLAGGAVPAVGSVALSLERMRGIESVDVAGATLIVQAGATLQSVQEAATAAGFVFGVDLGARGSCQIGGNLATNAGGNGVIQYGMAREQALGLEVVLADGTVLDMLRPMLKNNTGYDLKHWFIGSEGTLGVITRALLRLHPAPRAKATLLAALPDHASAVALLRRLKARFPGAVAAFELMWEDFYSASLSWQKLTPPLAQTPPMSVITEVCGSDEESLAEELQLALEEAMEAGEIFDAVLAQSQSQAAALWRIREASAEFPVHMQPVNFDISLPIDRMGDFAERCVQALAARWPRHRTVRFSHLGDGNLHLTTDARSLLDSGLARAQVEKEVEELVYALVEREGGSVSAEHGIGLHKKPYLRASRSDAELAAMRAIKLALDPLNLLNPGKVFDLTPSREG